MQRSSSHWCHWRSSSKSEVKFNKVFQLFNMVWLMHSMIIEKNCWKLSASSASSTEDGKSWDCWKTGSFLIIFRFILTALVRTFFFSTTYKIFVNFPLASAQLFIAVETRECRWDVGKIPAPDEHFAWCRLKNYRKHYVMEVGIYILQRENRMVSWRFFLSGVMEARWKTNSTEINV